MRRIFIADTDAEARTIARTAHRKWYDSITKLWHRRQDNSVDQLFDWDRGLAAETLLIGSPARVREQVTRLAAEGGINDVIGAFAGELADARPASSFAGFLGALSDACGEVNTRERA